MRVEMNHTSENTGTITCLSSSSSSSSSATVTAPVSAAPNNTNKEPPSSSFEHSPFSAAAATVAAQAHRRSLLPSTRSSSGTTNPTKAGDSSIMDDDDDSSLTAIQERTNNNNNESSATNSIPPPPAKDSAAAAAAGSKRPVSPRLRRLVSNLRGNRKHKQKKKNRYVQTPLHVLDDDDDEHRGEGSESTKDDDEERSAQVDDSPTTVSTVPLVLATNLTADVALGLVPSLQASRQRLLDAPIVSFSSSSRTRLVYVAQRELAHASTSSNSCDVLVSDHATTCHILALWSRSTLRRRAADGDDDDDSTTTESAAAEPLGSLTHIDTTGYDDCIRNMILRHKLHHLAAAAARPPGSQQEEELRDDVLEIELHIHVVGGFEDRKGLSRVLSNWLLGLLVNIAASEKKQESRQSPSARFPAYRLQLLLRTAVITSLNHYLPNGIPSPICRGLALDLATGNAYLARCEAGSMGPGMPLRAARVFSCSERLLHCIHSDDEASRLVIAPYWLEPHEHGDEWLALPDSELLKKTSTSPDCEEEDYCDSVRAALRCMRDVPYYQAFGSDCQRPLVFERAGSNNTWTLITPLPRVASPRQRSTRGVVNSTTRVSSPSFVSPEPPEAEGELSSGDDDDVVE